MRFLKKKIALAQASLLHHNKQTLQHPPQDKSNQTLTDQASSKKRRRIPGVSFTPENVRSTKNIAKNFGRAICSFATSHLAIPYLLPLCEEHKVAPEEFVAYVNKIKGCIDGLHKFRSILMINKDDSKEVVTYKEMFKKVGEIFIKNYSVNWIFSGKVQHKEAHLKFRYKMLRRIRCPELFTYIKKNNRRERSKSLHL